MKPRPNSVQVRGVTLAPDVVTLVQSLLRSDGYVYLAGIPEEFDHLAELSRLGQLVPQYGGDLIREVRPLDDVGDDVVSASNTKELTPHTEWYEFPGTPPRFVALWCVRRATGGGGETTLADGYRFLRQFSPDEQAQLRSTRYAWRSSPSLAVHGIISSALHPFLEEHDGRLLLRFSTQDITSADDGLLRRFISAGNAYFAESRMEFGIAENDVLVWDNWRMIHARNAFSDRSRHLRRVLISDHAESHQLGC